MYEPRNTRVADRHNFTDSWGWEASLWFSLGEDLRKGDVDFVTDSVPADVARAVQRASAKGLGLLAYVYPQLGFEGTSALVRAYRRKHCGTWAGAR